MTQAASLATVGSNANSSGTLLTASTAVTCAGQTSIDFTNIPSWVKRITVLFNTVSTNGSSVLQIQLGSGSIDATSYTGAATNIDGAIGGSANSTGFQLSDANSAASTMMGIATIALLGSNIWIFSANGTLGSAAQNNTVGAGVKTLSGTLDRIRITTVNGTDTFDTTPSAGSINILYE
jgi:hypothetical protein